jgi:hypothetical protein
VILRRAGALAAVVAVLVLSAAPAASAQEADPDWDGSKLTTPATTTSSSPDITADFVREYAAQTLTRERRVIASTKATAPAGLPAGCTASIGVTTVTKQDEHHLTDARLTTNCNGTYGIEVTARLQQRCWGGSSLCPWEQIDSRTLTGTIDIAAPAPAIGSVTAAPGDGRSIKLTWDPVASPPPDLLGYRIERATGAGGPVTIATIDDPAAASFVDEEPPAQGGSTTYTVYSRRASSRGELSSEPASVDTDVAPAPSGTGGSGGGGGAGGGGTTGGSGGASGRPSTGRIDTGGRPTRGITVPRVGTPSRNFFPPLLAPPDIDTGFDPTLPFEEQEPGDANAVLPDDELASDDLGERLPGRGLVVPVATGLVLAVWGLHLRFLARASRPVANDSIEILEV